MRYHVEVLVLGRVTKSLDCDRSGEVQALMLEYWNKNCWLRLLVNGKELTYIKKLHFLEGKKVRLG